MRFPTLLLSVVAAALLLAGGVLVPEPALAPAAVSAQALVVGLFAWLLPRAAGVLPALGTSAVLAVCGGAALATSWAFPLVDALLWWPACLAVGVLLGFVLQLLRGHDAAGRVEAMSVLVGGLLLTVSSAGWGAWVRQAHVSGTPSLGAWLCAGGSVLGALLVVTALLFSLRSGWGAGASRPARAAVPSAAVPGTAGTLDAAGDAPVTAPDTAQPATAPLATRTLFVASGLGAALAAGLPAALLSRLWG